VEHNPHFTLKGRAHLREEAEQLRENSTELEAFDKRQFPGLPVATLVVQGDPAAKIIECATAEGSDLIMMPTRECRPYRPFLLGIRNIESTARLRLPCVDERASGTAG
jgi:hypothetical protein